jgi:hypothetical protein
MPVRKWKVAGSAAEAEPGEGGQRYSGEVPPAGQYRVHLKTLRIKPNKNNDDMLNGILEIAEEDGSNTEYNGFGFWFNLNITEQGAGWVNNFLDAFGFDRTTFWKNGATVDNDDPETPAILKIGSKKVTKDMYAVANCWEKKATKAYPDASLDLDRFLLGDAALEKASGGTFDDEDEPGAEPASEPAGDEGDQPWTEEELNALSPEEFKAELAENWPEIDLATAPFKGRRAGTINRAAVVKEMLRIQEAGEGEPPF